MAAKKGGLGKGLDSLITDKVSMGAATQTAEKTRNEKSIEGIIVNINKVEPNREQPRKNFDEDALVELSESIKQFGVLQPLLVQDKKDYYEIIAGERRWRAAKLAGLKEVPVIIKDLTDIEIVEYALIENIQRENLNPIEEAFAYKRLLTEFNLKQDEVAERVSKSRTAVTNSMRLLKLDERVQQMVIDDMISTGHARALLGIEDKEKQFATAQKIFDEKLSVRETEKLVKKIQKEKCKFLLAYFSGCAYTRLRYGGSSSVGRAPGCGPGGRGFKSHLSPHKEIPPLSSGVFLFLPPGCRSGKGASAHADGRGREPGHG